MTGRCRTDAEFLFAKNFGHSVAGWIAVLFPADVERLCDAADRLGARSPAVAVREALPLAVMFTGRPPSAVTEVLGEQELGIGSTASCHDGEGDQLPGQRAAA